jgi:hypothetical protein
MIRSALAFGLATYVALASGQPSTSGDTTCSQRCPDDDSEGKCAPDCADCDCCPHVRVAFAVVEAKPLVASQSMRVPEQLQAEPASPEPGDILHVPITLLA